jgi:peptidoglycan hydrolase-like protein with peptidoglycan-binding domain
MSAVRAFQQAKGLPQDGGRYINMATVKALGVTP